MRLIPRAALTLLLLAAGCEQLGVGVVVTRPPPVKQPPVPSPFEGSEPPALESTETPGLLRAAALGEHVYFYEPEELWYRHAYRRWYQAFRWNGNWFILEETPELLAERTPEAPTLDELPTLPEYERDLPTLPEYEQFPPDSGTRQPEPDPGGPPEESDEP